MPRRSDQSHNIFSMQTAIKIVIHAKDDIQALYNNIEGLHNHGDTSNNTERTDVHATTSINCKK